MTVFERIQDLAKKQGKSVKDVSRDLGFGESTIYKWKTQSPKAKDLEKIADYFGVSVDFLLGREEKISLAEKHKIFAFDGGDITDEEVEFLRSVLAAKRAAEKK